MMISYYQIILPVLILIAAFRFINPTEDVPIDHYMIVEADKLLKSSFVKKNPEVKSYIERYLGFKEVNNI